MDKLDSLRLHELGGKWDEKNELNKLYIVK